MATIIPIAGGKGGVGKSLFTANLSRALAARGARAVAIDLDLGGSNLHTFLGYDNVHPGIGDYLASKGSPLSDFLVPVDDTSLSFIPGDGLRPFLANLHHAHKMRILRDLGLLNVDTVMLDLGAGTTFNTLDFFRVWGFGLVVTTPEYPAIINMMNFVKSVVLRTLVKGIGDNTLMTDAIEPLSKQSIAAEVETVPEIMVRLEAINPARTARIRQQLATLRFGLVVNRARSCQDLQFLEGVLAALRRKLGVAVDWYGTLFEEGSAKLGWHAPKGREDVPRLTGLARVAERVSQQRTVDHQSLLVEAEALYRHLNPENS